MRQQTATNNATTQNNKQPEHTQHVTSERRRVANILSLRVWAILYTFASSTTFITITLATTAVNEPSHRKHTSACQPLVGSLVGWFIGWLVHWLVGRLVGRSVGLGWLVGWVGWPVGSCVGWFVLPIMRSFVSCNNDRQQRRRQR